MKTKIEIIKAEVPENCIWEDKLDNAPFKYVEAAMDEYAKEVAIAFAIDYNKGQDDRMEVRYEHFLKDQQEKMSQKIV